MPIFSLRAMPSGLVRLCTCTKTPGENAGAMLFSSLGVAGKVLRGRMDETDRRWGGFAERSWSGDVRGNGDISKKKLISFIFRIVTVLAARPPARSS